MQCPRCNVTLAQLTKFCPKCGEKLGEASNGVHEVYLKLRDQHKELKAANEKVVSGLDKLENELVGFQILLERQASAAQPASPELPHAPETEQEFGFEPGPTIRTAAALRPTPPQSPPQSPKTPQRPASRSPATMALELKLGQNWLLMAGIVIMVFGVGYFLKYSFDQGWVGPAARVALAYLWAALFLGGGELFRRKGYRTYGLAVVGGGVAVLYFATFAGFKIYEIIPAIPAFGLMALTTALAMTLAVFYDVAALALLGLVGGFLTPVLLSTGTDRPVALMSYIALLNAGILATAFKKRWTMLARLGFIATYVLYAAWYDKHYVVGKIWPALVFLHLFFLIYTVIPLLYDMQAKGPDQDQSKRGKAGFIPIPNGFIVFGFTYASIEPVYGGQWVALFSCGYAALFLGLAAWLLSRKLQHLDSFTIMLANGALYISLAIPLLFSGHWITIFWAIQAALLLWTAFRLERRTLAVAAHVLLALSLSKFFLWDYPEVYHLTLGSQAGAGFSFKFGYGARLVERMLSLAVLAAALAACVRLCRGRTLLGAPAPAGRDAALGLSLLLAGLTFVTLNIECSAFFYDVLRPARSASISVLWTLFSVGLIVVGFKKNAKALRVAALCLFAATVLKVVLVDMAQVSTPYRIISFIVLGVVLVATSFLYHRFKSHIQKDPPDTPAEEQA